MGLLGMLGGVLGIGALSGCTQAPAPCAGHADCPQALCVNGACVSASALDGGVVFDGSIGGNDRGAVDRGPDDGDDGVTDAGPIADAQPECEHLMLDVQVTNNAEVVRRNESVDMRVTAIEGAEIEYSSSAGGAFLDLEGGKLWIARDDVDWPWFTDRITLTVTARFEGCQQDRQIQVTLLGDLLVADVLSGRLDVFGSNGTPFGQWRLIDQTGIGAMARMPDGGFVVGTRGRENDPDRMPEIIRLNANGEEILRFEMTDQAGQDIFTRVIEHLHVRDGLVIASNTTDDMIRWFTFEGELVRSVDCDCGWIEALAPRGGTVVFSRNRERPVYEVQGDDTLDIVARASGEVYGLHPLPDGTTLMVTDANRNEVELLDAGGRILPMQDPPINHSINALTRFDEGYIALSQRSSRLVELDANLVFIEDFEFAGYQAQNPRQILWLHTD